MSGDERRLPTLGPRRVPTDPEAARMGRRTALKILASAAALPVVACGPGEQPPVGGAPTGGNPLAKGTPADPDLVLPVVPWEPKLSPDEMETLTVLCDLILPEDERSPGASQVGVPAFINEWVSAPYRAQENDLILVRGGLAWLNSHAVERFEAPFAALSPEDQSAICGEIAYLPDAAPEHRVGARFFDKVRDLTMMGFYTTPEGMEDLGYVGNRAMASWDGPPPEILRRLGLDAEA